MNNSEQKINEMFKRSLFPKDGQKKVMIERIPVNSTMTQDNVLDLLTPNADSLA